MHPELHGALNNALAYGDISQGRLIEAHTTTAWRWVKTAVKRAEELGAIAPGKHISTHTLRHSYARHLLMNGIPINYLSRWLGHSSIQTTLIYLELVPGPDGQLGDGAVNLCQLRDDTRSLEKGSFYGVKSFLLYGPTCWREPNVGSVSNQVLLPIWTALPYTRP